jgi:general secretion pathway protein L
MPISRLELSKVFSQVTILPSLVFIKAVPAGGYQWLCLDSDSHAPEGPRSGSLEQCQAELAGSSYQLSLLLPGDSVSTRLMPFARRERRHLRQAIPYQLEELLAGDVEALHFSLGQWRMAERAQDDSDAVVACAWCDRIWLQQQLQPFAELGLELCNVLPEPLVLRRDSGWVLRLEETLWCHIDDGFGFAIDGELATDALAMLCLEHGLPTRLVVSAQSQSELQRLQQLLPQVLQGIAEPRCESLWQLISPETSSDADLSRPSPEINLLQGEFARRLPLATWWRQWRSVAALLAIALIAWSANNLVHIRQQRVQQQQFEMQIESAFRSVIPEGVLVDAEKQLRNRLQSLGSNSNYTGPVSLIARIAPIFEQDETMELRGLSYNQRQGDIRLNCRAQSFSAIEQLLARLQRSGLRSQLVHSSADGEGQQARFRIAWGLP